MTGGGHSHPGHEILLEVRREAVDAAEAALTELGALAVTLTDAGDHPVLEPAPGETPLWPELVAIGYFAVDDPTPLLETLKDQGYQRAASREVGRRDWVRAWMDDFRPLRFGDRLWVVPTHCEPPPGAEIILRLDPGLAFGTGTHATTALCLEFLDRLDLTGRQVLDFGCGSGILAIAAALLGAARSVGIDNDPQAEMATRDNAGRNGVADRVQVAGVAELKPAAFDVVVANILAGTLVELAPLLARLCRPGGRIALSGLLDGQVPLVMDAYRNQFSELKARRRDGWALVTAVREEATAS